LVPYHAEELLPEIGHVVLLREGRVVADGPRAGVLVPELLSKAFGAPLRFVDGDVPAFVPAPEAGDAWTARSRDHPRRAGAPRRGPARAYGHPAPARPSLADPARGGRPPPGPADRGPPRPRRVPAARHVRRPRAAAPG